MFNFRLFFNLIIRSFSLSRKSLRFPSLKRICIVVFVFPLYGILLLNNYLFLLLDEILFPSYRKINLSKTLFITGVPRTATTYVFSILARDRSNYTCFRFWELLFAPSILQKYFFIGLQWINRRTGKPLSAIVRLVDSLVFGKFRGIHDIGLAKPEEDEVIFMYSFTSLYLSYFFPELSAVDKYLLFDDLVDSREKERLMRFYSSFLKRHFYVFNRNSGKYFLSKNPSFVSRLHSLSNHFPDARFVYMLRSPYKTIPATISLNAHIYSATCRLPEPYPLAGQTREIMALWYKMADHAMNKCIMERGQTVYFRNITERPMESILGIYNMLEVTPGMNMINELEKEEVRTRNYRSPHIYDDRVGVDKEWIENEIGHLFSDEIMQKI